MMARSEMGNFAQGLSARSCVVMVDALEQFGDDLTVPSGTTHMATTDLGAITVAALAVYPYERR